MPLPSDAVHSGHRLATRFLMMHPRRRSLKELAVGEPAAGAGSSLPDMMMNAVVGGLQAAVPASLWDDLWVMQIPPAEKVLRKSRRPVLVVKQAPHEPYRRVLRTVAVLPRSCSSCGWLGSGCWRR